MAQRLTPWQKTIIRMLGTREAVLYHDGRQAWLDEELRGVPPCPVHHTTLRALQRHGCVHEESRRGTRTYFTLTDTGRERV